MPYLLFPCCFIPHLLEHTTSYSISAQKIKNITPLPQISYKAKRKPRRSSGEVLHLCSSSRQILYLTMLAQHISSKTHRLHILTLKYVTHGSSNIAAPIYLTLCRHACLCSFFPITAKITSDLRLYRFPTPVHTLRCRPPQNTVSAPPPLQKPCRRLQNRLPSLSH